MISIAHLFVALGCIEIMGCWFLYSAIQQALDAYEDHLGFHFGNLYTPEATEAKFTKPPSSEAGAPRPWFMS